MAKKCSTCAPYLRTALFLLAALWLWGNGELAFHFIANGSFDALQQNAATQIAIVGDILLPFAIIALILRRVLLSRKKK